MNKLLSLAKPYASIPEPVKRFLIRALIIFISWKLVYNVILLPRRIPDSQLTSITAKTTSLFFNIVHTSKATFQLEHYDGDYKMIFFIDGHRAIGIADRCNALELMVLYAGFLFCIPYSFKKQFIYAVVGIGVIFLLNILRCYALAWLNLHHSSVADVAHKFIFTMIIYALIFITWIKYSSNYFSK